jgi:Uma2 family endonuclease
MPELKKAELIAGRVYTQPRVSHLYHGAPHAWIVGTLVLYRISTPGVDVGDNSTWRLDAENEPQPDCMLRIKTECGGRCPLDDRGYLIGAPELIAEIALSSASYDLHDKKRAYRKAGVCEYVVWRTRDRAIDWFVLEDGDYAPLPADEHGVFRSRIFPGLWLDALALLRDDLPRVKARLEQGLASADHAKFVARLQAAQGR